jgi:hypothetical protein
MANAQENKPGRFVVDLGSVDISPEIADRIEGAVRQAVLGTIAGLDLQHQVTLGLDPGWRGIRIRLPKTGLAKLKDTIAR